MKLLGRTEPPLRVLHTGAPGARVDAQARALAEAGIRVTRAQGIRDVLRTEPGSADVLVIDTGESGDLTLLDECERGGVTLPIVLVAPTQASSGASFELVARARELGAARVVQDAFDPSAVVVAVEEVAEAGSSRPRRAGGLPHHLVTYTREHTLELTAVRDLVGYLARHDVPLPHIVRIACATGELVANVAAHAYPTGNFVGMEVEAALRHSRVTVDVSDSGCGLDPRIARLDTVPAALPAERAGERSPRLTASSGLARASSLAEHIVFDVHAGVTRVSLDFELSPVRCEDGAGLPEIESLLPGAIRELTRTARSSSDFPPAFSLVVRRLLEPRPRHHASL